MITDQFVAPRNPAKVRENSKHLTVNTKNQFMVLSDDEQSETETNSKLNSISNKKNKLNNNGKTKTNIENPESINNETNSKINRLNLFQCTFSYQVLNPLLPY